MLATKETSEPQGSETASSKEAHDLRKVESLPIVFGIHDLRRLYAYCMWRMFGC
jgi:hypothetical protein